MNAEQIYLVDKHEAVILEFLYEHPDNFLSYLERKKAINSETRSNQEMNKTSHKHLVDKLFQLLQRAENGWTCLIAFLKEFKGGHIAKLLEGKSIGVAADTSLLESFKCQLANYYTKKFGCMETLSKDSNIHISKFWVPLQIEDNTTVQGVQFEHGKMQMQLKSHPYADVAVVKGDPGTGKTTLVKKICYDWATQPIGRKKNDKKESSEIAEVAPFSLVLAVQLRYAKTLTFHDYVQSAVDYFVDILKLTVLTAQEQSQLIGLIKGICSDDVLVILDGLDEYENFANSQLSSIFAPAHKPNVPSCKILPPLVQCKVIITSRPYAVEKQINRDFVALRYQLCPLNVANLHQFVNNYCRKPEGKAKVQQYLADSKDIVIQIPLILTFICYLADENIAIPTNLTSLYQQMIRQMLIREQDDGKLRKEQIDMAKWKDSNLVESVGQLAFLGCTNVGANGEYSVQLEFDVEMRQKCGVTEDSFTCGFLLDKQVLADSHKAQFPHQSIQEFFAALYCYQWMLNERNKGERSEESRNSLLKVILNQKDSQISRFFFGICSIEKKFPQMAEWLKISFEDVQLCRERGISGLINSINKNLIDCSADYQSKIGGILLDSVKSISWKSIAKWNQPWKWGCVDYLNDNFLDAVNISKLTEMIQIAKDTKMFSWQLATQPRLAQVVQLSSGHELPECLISKFNKIELFMWTCSDLRSVDDLCQTPSLPQIETFQWQTQMNCNPDFVVTIRLAGVRKGKFRFQFKIYDKLLLYSMLDQFTTVMFSTDTVAVDRGSNMDSTIYFRLTVTVNQSISQSTLICSLLKLALNLDYTDTSDGTTDGTNKMVVDVISELQKWKIHAAANRCKSTRDNNCVGLVAVIGSIVESMQLPWPILDRIRYSLAQIRSPHLSIKLKTNLVSTLVEFLQNDNGNEWQLAVKMSIAMMRNALIGETIVFAQILAEMLIYADEDSPYDEAVKQILFHIFTVSTYSVDDVSGNVVLELLNQIVLHTRSDKNYMGTLDIVEIICNLIWVRLGSPSYWSVSLDSSWMCLTNICQDNSQNQNTFLSADGMKLFRECYKVNIYCGSTNSFTIVQFRSAKQNDLVEVMMRLMLNLSENVSLRQQMLESCDIFWHIWSQNLLENSKEVEHNREVQRFFISFRCAQILISLTDCLADWPLISPTTDEVKSSIAETVAKWNLEIVESYLTYTCFKEDLANLVKISRSHQLRSARKKLYRKFQRLFLSTYRNHHFGINGFITNKEILSPLNFAPYVCYLVRLILACPLKWCETG